MRLFHRQPLTARPSVQVNGVTLYDVVDETEFVWWKAFVGAIVATLAVGAIGGVVLACVFWLRRSAAAATWVLVTGIVAANAAFIGFLLRRHFGARRQAVQNIERGRDLATGELLVQAAGQIPSGAIVLHRQRLLPALVAQARIGQVVRFGPAARLTPVEPLAVDFEPKVIDESEPSFEEFESAVTATPEPIDDAKSETQPERESRLFKRRIRRRLLMGGLVMLLVIGLQLVLAAIDAYAKGRMTWRLMIFMAVIVVLLLTGSSTMQFRPGAQWMLAPASLIVWTAKRTRIYQAPCSLLFVIPLRRTVALLAVAGDSGVDAVNVTTKEAEIVLRAWLSPIPPPPIERLSDLA